MNNIYKSFYDYDYADNTDIISHFNLLLVAILVRADNTNKSTIRKVYPEYVDAFEEWNKDHQLFYNKYNLNR